MKYLFTLALSFMVFTLANAQSDVTFKVDMSNFSDSYSKVFLSGSFNGWSANANEMTDADGDDIYEITVSLNDGDIEYKYQLDEWQKQEVFAGGESCTKTTGEFTNRFYSVSGAATLDVVCYNSCTSCSSAPQLSQIDLPITWDDTTVNRTVSDFGGNASELAEDPTNANNTVLKSTKTSSGATWAGTTLSTPSGLANAIPVTAENTIMSVDVYSPDAGTPVRFKIENSADPTQSVETEVVTTKSNEWETLIFDFSNEAPNTAELNPSYTFDLASIFYNFGTTGADAGEKVYYCDNIIFGTQEDPIMIMFQVDMTEYTDEFTNVYLSGAFNGWCENCAQMTDDNDDNIYEVSVEMTQPGEIEYKFQLDSWNAEETFEGGESCTKTTGEFTNRVYTVESSDTLDVVCWASCETCSSVGIDQQEGKLSVYPNPASNLVFVQVNGATHSVGLLNSQGQVVSVKNTTNNNTLSFDVSNMASGIYFVRMQQDDKLTIKKIVVE